MSMMYPQRQSLRPTLEAAIFPTILICYNYEGIYFLRMSQNLGMKPLVR